MKEKKVFKSVKVRKTEVVDKEANIAWTDGQEADIKQRSDRNYWLNEVPKLVNSGTYSRETMIEKGWIIVNEKGRTEINKNGYS